MYLQWGDIMANLISTFSQFPEVYGTWFCPALESLFTRWLIQTGHSLSIRLFVFIFVSSMQWADLMFQTFSYIYP